MTETRQRPLERLKNCAEEYQRQTDGWLEMLVKQQMAMKPTIKRGRRVKA